MLQAQWKQTVDRGKDWPLTKYSMEVDSGEKVKFDPLLSKKINQYRHNHINVNLTDNLMK